MHNLKNSEIPKIRKQILEEQNFICPLWGTHCSEETKRKISLANKGKSRMTEKHKEKLKKSNTGSRWMYNLELKESHRVVKERIPEFLEKGYQYGRIRNFDKFEN